MADEALQAEMDQEEVEVENVASNEELMEEMDVDPTYRNNWTDRQIKSKTHQQNRTPLPTVASIIARGEGSRRFAAAIVTAKLVDYKIVTAENTSQIAIRKTKFRGSWIDV